MVLLAFPPFQEFPAYGLPCTAGCGLPRPHEPHRCSRFCSFKHLVGNAYECTSSQTLHVCDQNCAERVQLDAYTSVCRLSRKHFHHTPQLACRKRCAGEEAEAQAGAKRAAMAQEECSPMLA